MAIALAIFGVAFAAFCVWLGVRIVNRRERWTKWTAVVLALLAAYPLSIGPMFAVFVEPNKPNPAPKWFDAMYEPVYKVAFSAPQTLGAGLLWYLMIWGAQP
jgi:hypothetical protein